MATYTPITGAGNPLEARRALFAPFHLSITDNLEHALAGQFDYYLWTGEVVSDTGSSDGRYWIPALFASKDLHAALLDVARKSKTPKTPEQARKSMARYHSGLGKRLVALSPFAYCEIDHLTRLEQEARYAALTTFTGLEWCLLVSSGRKSIHAYIRFLIPLNANDPRRERVQRLLVVCLEGDSRITDAARLMRLPGWCSPDPKGRQQHVLHRNDADAYDADDVIDRLEKYAASMGITSGQVDAAYEALQTAELLVQEAKPRKNAPPSNAPELLAQAETIRLNRATWQPGSAPRVVGAGTGRSSRFDAPTGGRQPIPDEFLEAYEAAEVWSYNPTACCPGKSDRGQKLPGVLTIFCQRCRTTFVGTQSSTTPTTPTTPGVLTVDSLLKNISSKAPKPETKERTSALEDVRLILDLEADNEPHGENVPRSLMYEGYKTARDISTEGRWKLISHEEDGTEALLLEEAQTFLSTEEAETLMTSWCSRAPALVTATLSKLTYSKLACACWTCTTCGPRSLAALRAAAHVVITRGTTELEFHYGIREYWSVATTTQELESHLLKRWSADSVGKGERIYLSIQTRGAPDTVETLLAWRGTINAPEGKLALNLTTLTDTSVADASYDIISRVDLQSFDGIFNDKITIVHGGSSDVTAMVCKLRDQIIGRKLDRKAKADANAPRILTGLSPTALKKYAEEKFDMPVRRLATSVSTEKRTLTATMTYDAGEGGLEQAVVSSLVEERKRKKMGVVPAADLDGILDTLID